LTGEARIRRLSNQHAFAFPLHDALFLAQPAWADAAMYRTQAPIAYLVDAHSGVVLLDKASDEAYPDCFNGKNDDRLYCL
jgi:D-alanyl-D-alanine carboxypeptidase